MTADLTDATPLLEATDLRVLFPVRRGLLGRVHGHVHAVDGISLTIARGATQALVGESGSGKSTVARAVAGLQQVTSGRIAIDGTDSTSLRGGPRRAARDRVQMVFQDPYSSFDPTASVGDSVSEGLARRGLRSDARSQRVRELLDDVGLADRYADRLPAELSGGQLQRAAVARALAMDPQLLILDEPVSALDVSIQAQVVNLLSDLQEARNLALLFVSHDLSVVRHLCERVAVMYLGRIVEEGPASSVFESPLHPYTASLLSAVPIPDPQAQRERRRIILTGEVPSAIAPPSGCRFRTRCPYAMDVCDTEPPRYETADHVGYCHLHTTGPTLGGRSVGTLPRHTVERP